jgi:serine-type D-Ala-D-Ala carboxypeptidase/endopeptidase (penicillin-binding protein 4)
MRSSSILFVTLLFAVACSPISKSRLTKDLHKSEQRLQSHIGVMIYDPSKDKTVFEFQSDRYFTPASNTKVLTFFTALNVLSDSVPGVRYILKKDSLVVWGLGDPSFLNKECFDNGRLYSFLLNAQRPVYLSTFNFKTTPFGRGWAWDDYNDYYSPERSSFPIYGNTFSFYPLPDQTLVVPKYFTKFFSKGEPGKKAEVVREVLSNRFTFHRGTDGRYKDFVIPFRIEKNLIASLLSDTLHIKVKEIEKPLPKEARYLYTVPSDSLYKVMMQQSDNHIAEQLLLVCSSVLSDTLKPEIAISHMQKKHFGLYPDKPVWVDGSGLSRYNLFTPRFMVRLWSDIYKLVPQQRLFPLLATGGKPGTLKNWYVANKPYVFGKTGTLSNNHSLSGYLVTKKGTVLIFAFMNANYVKPINEVRNNMQRILNLYYDNY